MLKAPPMGAMRYFQMKTMAPPAIIPARAPCRFIRFQNRARIITGPKAAPKPAQAKDTMRKTELLGFQARRMPTMAMPTTVSRAAVMEAFWLSFTRKKSWTRSWETPEAAVRSWESAVDMVQARMPAMTMPAIRAKKTPWVLSRSASRMTMVSDSELEVRKGMAPALLTL